LRVVPNGTCGKLKLYTKHRAAFRHGAEKSDYMRQNPGSLLQSHNIVRAVPASFISRRRADGETIAKAGGARRARR